MNVYFICVIVHVQMWCMCAQPYVDQTKKIFVLFVCFWKWFVSPMFSNFFKLFLCEKHVFVTHFMCKLSWELNGPIFKFFSFTQRFLWLFRYCFASKAYQRNTSKVLVKFREKRLVAKYLRNSSESFCMKMWFLISLI